MDTLRIAALAETFFDVPLSDDAMVTYASALRFARAVAVSMESELAARVNLDTERLDWIERQGFGGLIIGGQSLRHSIDLTRAAQGAAPAPAGAPR